MTLDAAKASFWFPTAQADVSKYELDANASQLTATYTWTGSKWECLGDARANLVFAKKAVAPGTDFSDMNPAGVVSVYDQDGAHVADLALSEGAYELGDVAGDGPFYLYGTIKGHEQAYVDALNAQAEDGFAYELADDNTDSNLEFTLKAAGQDGAVWASQVPAELHVRKVEPVPDTHTVTLVLDGNGTTETYEVKDGLAFGKPADPTLDGWTFSGWSVNESGTFVAYDFSTPVTSDLTLYAWYVPAKDTATPEEPGDVSDTATPGDTATDAEQKGQAQKPVAKPVTTSPAKHAVPNTGDATNTAAAAGVGLAGVLAAVAGYLFKRRTNG